MKTFSVYKVVDGKKIFWMNARGTSAAQLKNSIWWRNKGKIPKSSIIVESIMSNIINREYFCPACNVKFNVIHQNDGLNSHCGYCNNPITETGVTEIVDENTEEVVIYDNGKEVGRRKSAKALREEWLKQSIKD